MVKMADREMKRGTMELVLLKLISERPMYGYELIISLEQRGGDAFKLKEGTLYPVLYRLESDGLVETYWEMVERGVPRKYYRLTEAGAMRLKEWVADWLAFSSSVNRILETEE